MICDACGQKVGTSMHSIGARHFCDACCPECNRIIETQHGRWQVRIALVVICVLCLALLGTCYAASIHAAPDVPADWLAMALCPARIDCTSWVQVYATPEDLRQVMYLESFDPPPDVTDWQSVPESGLIETRALGVYLWSPDGMFFEAHLLGQLYRVKMPLIF